MRLKFVCAVIVGMASSAAQADVVTIGDMTGADCTFPCTETLQQAYDSSYFDNPFDITSISFFSTRFHITNATYALSIGYMNGDYSAMTSNFAANRGAQFSSFDTITINGEFNDGDVHTFNGLFSYDPGQGDLMIEIVRSAITGTNYGNFASTAGTNDTLLARAYRFTDNGRIFANSGYGITTRFNTEAAPQSVPAPGALALLGLGLIGIAARRRTA